MNDAARPAEAEHARTAGEVALARANDLFEAGDYARARAAATTLARSDETSVREGARALLAKVRVDPAAIWIGVATFLLLCALTYWYALR